MGSSSSKSPARHASHDGDDDDEDAAALIRPHGEGGGTSGGEAADTATFGMWAGVACTVNYIIGTGILGIPAAFAKSGLLLGPAFVFAGAGVMNASKDFLLEALARAEALHKAGAITERALRDAKAARGGARGGRRRDSLALIVPSDGDYVINTARKFELTDLFNAFVGPRAVPVYALLLSMYMYGGLVSYTSVWSASWSANVALPGLHGGVTCNIETDAGCRPLYTAWLLVFAALAVPLSCADLEEQLPLQVAMFAARLLVVGLLTGTVLAGFGCDGVSFAEFAPGGLPSTPLANVAGLPVIIPVAVFAFIFHHSVPGLSQPIADKRSLRRVFAVSFAIVTVAYAAIGFFIALSFGTGVASQCSLNWQKYVGCMPRPGNYTGYGVGGAATGGPWGGDVAGEGIGSWSAARALWGAAAAAAAAVSQGGSSGAPRLSAAPACSSAATWADNGSCIDWQARPAWATAVSFIVLIFPALDVLSAFPLNAVTLGNNLMSAVLGDAALAPPTPAEERAYVTGGGRRGAAAAAAAAASGSAEVTTPLAGAADGGASGDAAATPKPKPWFLRTRRGHRLTKVAFRLLAAVPPVVVAGFVTDLGNILQFTGLVGVGIAFTIPALLRAYSLARERTVFAHVSRVLLPRAGVATLAEVDAAAPLPSVRGGRGRVGSDGDDAWSVDSGGGGGGGGGGGAHLHGNGGGGGARTAPGEVSSAEIAAAVAAGKALPISLVEALSAYPCDAALRTPYTSWATRARGAQIMLVASLGMGAYVLVQTVLDVTGKAA